MQKGVACHSFFDGDQTGCGCRSGLGGLGIRIETGAGGQFQPRVQQQAGALRRNQGIGLTGQRSAIASPHAAAQIAVALFMAGQKAGQFRQGQFVHPAFELHHHIQWHPVIVPAPGIKLGVVGGTQVQIPVVSGQLQQIPDLLLPLVMAPRVTAYVTVWHLVAQPIPGAGHHANVVGLQPHFFMQFPEHGLFGRFAPINAALWELPAVGADAFSPEHLVLVVEQDDADVRAKSVPVKHNRTPILSIAAIMHGALHPARSPTRYSVFLPMKASQFLISTLKEAPADAEVVSHKLMTRAGMIKKLGAGIYNYMPMGLRVIRKVEAIVREEMNRAGAVEVTMPVVQPAELWQETGRFEKMGPELLRIKDRHERDFVIQPTSEEVVTDIARQEFKSYKQLPKNLYQIQTKFRDERRPRFGLMRGREFIMKDAYSFDKDRDTAQISYQTMREAYKRIFDRFGLQYRAVRADSGAIGGDLSEEFQVIASTGEDAIVYCPQSDYAANIEKAESLAPTQARPAAGQAMAKVATPGNSTCESVAAQLGLPLAQTVKSLVLATDELDDKGLIAKTQVWLLLLRGDHEMNEIKVGKVDGLAGFRFASVPEIEDHFGCKPGYLGPINLKKPVNLVVDRDVAVMADWVCGANEEDFHITGVNFGRDLPEPALVADLRNVVAGDPSPDGAGALAIERGIEIGHVFYLGTKYSQAMNATFLGDNGKPQHFEMGCYGIGVTRLPAAAIEQNHDERGIIWPDAIAPFTVVVCPIGMGRSEAVKTAAEQLYSELLALGVDVILDDRDERPGAMLADWELIGVPHRVVLGDRGLKDGVVEYQHRRDTEATKIAAGDILSDLKARLGLN